MPKKPLVLISWNVNGLRAVYRKGFLDFLTTTEPDILAIQETKILSPDLLPTELKTVKNYNVFWQCHKTKAGYSGVGIYSKLVPEQVVTNFSSQVLSEEGRLLELHFTNFIFLNIYFPNGGASELRLAYKLKFYDHFLKHLKQLEAKFKKPIIFCGDGNTAHQAIDLARPKANEKNSGFKPEERVWLDKFRSAGFIDAFRELKPQTICYSYWDQKTRARDRNVGWRIDYFYLSKNLLKKVKSVDILTDIYGSDHAPVYLKINI